MRLLSVGLWQFPVWGKCASIRGLCVGSVCLIERLLSSIGVNLCLTPVWNQGGFVGGSRVRLVESLCGSVWVCLGLCVKSEGSWAALCGSVGDPLRS